MAGGQHGAADEDSEGAPRDLDDVLVNEVGQFGRFQIVNFLLVSVPLIISAFSSDYIFTAAAIPHRCRVPECGEDSKSSLFKPGWIINAIPSSDGRLASCQRFVPVGGNGSLNYCPANLFLTDTEECQSFVYARDNSLVYDFDLGCQEWMRVLAGTMSSVGGLLVLPLIGYISDGFGRRIALVISAFNMTLFGLFRAFSVNYIMFLALQIIQNTLGGGLFSTAYILATEYVGPKYRVFISATCASLFSVGQMLLGSVAWLVQPWRNLIMTLHIPCFLVITYYWFISESVRWQLSVGKFDEAKETLLKIARVNKKVIRRDEKSLKALLRPPPKPLKKDVDDTGLVESIFKSRVLLRRVCTTPIWWITTTFVFYGLSINATSLSDKMYLNYILTCAIEIPGSYAPLLFLDRIGRKPTLCGGFLFSAVCNIAFVFIDNDLTVLRLVVYLFGKFGISVVFMSLYLYTSELYPTKYRHSLLAFSSMVGRIGSITAPLTPVLKKHWDGIPSVMFGVMAIISGVLVLTQPETLGTKMPDTLAEAEAIGTPESKIQQSAS